MSHPRAIDDDKAKELEQWFSEYEAIGTVIAKCRELGIDKVTFYDTIRRVRGQDTKGMRAKLAVFQRGVGVLTVEHSVQHSVQHTTTLHVEPQLTVEEHNATPNND